LNYSRVSNVIKGFIKLKRKIEAGLTIVTTATIIITIIESVIVVVTIVITNVKQLKYCLLFSFRGRLVSIFKL